VTKLGYVPIYSSLTGLELKPSTIIRPRRPDQSYIPELVGSASAGGLSHLQKLMGILGKEKMGILLKVSHQSQTAFHAACSENRLPVIEFLYSNFDIDLEGKSGSVKITPLFCAVAGNSKEATRWLLAHGAKKDNPSKSGKTPYDVAVNRQLAEIIAVLDAY